MMNSGRSRSRSSSPLHKRPRKGDVAPTTTCGVDPNFDDVVDVVKRYICANSSQFAKFLVVTFAVFMAYEIKVFFVSVDFGLFIVLTPVTYGLVGFILYADQGWKFIQPGIGGARFVAFNGFGWPLYAISILLLISNAWLSDNFLSVLGFVSGLLSFMLIVSGLFTYSNLKPQFLGVIAPVSSTKLTTVFNEEIQLSQLMLSGLSGETPSDLWRLFIGIQVLLATGAFWINAGFLQSPIGVLKVLANLLSMSVFAAAVPITHAIGGKWKHINTSYSAWQPFRGGKRYIFSQFLGWTCFSLSILLGLLLFASQVQRHTRLDTFVPEKISSIAGVLEGLWDQKRRFSQGGLQYVITNSSFPDETSAIVGVLGLMSEAMILISLYVYKDGPLPSEFQGKNVLTSALFACLNFVFRNRSIKDRKVVYESASDWLKGEQKFQELVREVKTTGDQYLIIGSGFVGKRLIKRLLERGETRIRVFDISPHNAFEGDERVEYVCGDVTKASSIGPACRGVNTVYSTFAIIRFMDRLEHQAALSYTVNVVGTERVIDACKENNVSRMVVTSSSHSTTDEHSQPRLGRDESAPYVVRETAHNHYGWTKAIADKIALEADGVKTQNGGTLQVAIVRPCSAVFGADDRLTFEKTMDLKVAFPLGGTAFLDFVYVENVVLGHLLLEDALQKQKPVGGEAYCISNDDAVTMCTFWSSVIEHIDRMGLPIYFEFIWIPMWPLWMLSYISEWNQQIFKGKVSLGSDVDMLSPGLMATVGMTYSYKSDKARQHLGYEPAYSVDQAIQISLIEYVNSRQIGVNRKKVK